MDAADSGVVRFVSRKMVASAAVSRVEDCIHPVSGVTLPCLTVAQLSLWLHTGLTVWFYQSASLLPLFPALHVDSYHWTSGVSCVQTGGGGGAQEAAWDTEDTA